MRRQSWSGLIWRIALLAAIGCNIGATIAEASVYHPAADIAAGRAALMSDPQRAYRLGEEIGRKARTIQARDDRAAGLTASAWLLSAALLEMNRGQDAVRVASRALADPSLTPVRNSDALGDLYLAQALAFGQLGKTDLSLKGLKKAYETFLATRNTRSQAIVLQNIGSLHIAARDYRRAADYYAQSADRFPEDPSLRVSAYANQALALKNQNRSREAIATYQQAIQAARRMNADLLEARLFGDLADTYLDDGNLIEAKRAIASAERSARRAGSNDHWNSIFYGVTARLALMAGDTFHASRLIRQAIAAVQPTDSTRQLIYLHRTAYKIFKLSGDDQAALIHLEQYKQLDDQDTSLAASAEAALVSAQFDFASKNLKIAQLRADGLARDATIARDKANMRYTVLALLLAAAGVISTLLLISFLSIRRSRDRVRVANAELSVTNSELEKALAARTEFLATTSHEIRTPLNGILGMTQVLLADHTLGSGHKEQIELVHGAGRTMRALVDDILDVAKMAKGELTIHEEPMDLHALLREAAQVWEAQAHTKQVAIALDPADSPDRIVADEMRLRQIIFNLMSNAVKFTDRGAVTLRATVHQDRVTAQERLHITVSDTGLGIPADRLGDIFESFRQVDGGTTRRHGGSGLGLAICRSLSEAMGGTITVDSVLGAGAAFTVDLPLQRIVAHEQAHRTAASALEGARLLLLDPNPLSRSVLQALLAPHVHAIEAVSDAAAAMLAPEGAGIDLMLADAAAFRADPAQAPPLVEAIARQSGRVALLWSLPDDAVRAALADMPEIMLVQKPITGQDLVAAMKGIYKTNRTPAEIAA